MKLATLNPAPYSFSAKNSIANKNYKRHDCANKTPISRAGETSLLIKSTFFAGLTLGGKLLFELFDGDFIMDIASEKAGKIVEKNKTNVKGMKKSLLKFGASIGIIAGIVGIFATLYTLLNAPKIAYKSKVNNFTKGKKMDVYVQANKAERELYSQLDKQAQTADEAEKQKLKENYMQMVMAKNSVPDFVKLKNKKA